jgi:hypothetical protein
MAVQRRSNFNQIFGVVSQADFSVPIERDSSYWDYVISNSKKRITGILWNGNQHNIHFLLESGEKFKIFEIFEENPDDPVVPQSQLRALFDPTFEELRNVLKKFPKKSKLLLIETPPPKSKRFIDRQLSDPNFVGNLMGMESRSHLELRATSDALRIAIWKFTQQITKEIADEFGVCFIPTPRFAFDEIGLLKEEFWTDDFTHANEDFGELLLNHLIKDIDLT